ncbi:dihydroorotase [Colletotrichum spaethianum]|uniref:Dihydroorotase n=1 Tax=Colletotrichum spaethianum TaxID=700344 RepID=A0AA37PDR1_9PEZI|nr:dihydroorotase [Colletotrichum spaethianum]GKT50338.1 dihydroorotase [Colletotrichum spaethianum]
MPLPDTVELPAGFDAHVHLRDGDMCKVCRRATFKADPEHTNQLIVPDRRPDCPPGWSEPARLLLTHPLALIMPNLAPTPVTTVKMALDYSARIKQAVGKDEVDLLMTLYLHPDVTPETIREAKKAGVAAVKSYPAGVTTNSSAGVVDYDAFHEVFKTMEEVDLILCLHGECPSHAGSDITTLNAESKVSRRIRIVFWTSLLTTLLQFLPTLKALHAKYPKLRIILEHCTTAEAVEAVKSCHHLFITIDDVVGDALNFCKPVAKLPADRKALLNAVAHSNGKFFLGTDSAPHPITSKTGPSKAAAGVFTQPYAVQYLLAALDEAVARGELRDEDITQEGLEGFVSGYGRKFYGTEDVRKERIRLTRGGAVVNQTFEGAGIQVVPFRAGKETWSLEWL